MSTLSYQPDYNGNPSGVVIEITPIRFDGSRHQFRWTVREVGGTVIATHDDLWSGSQVAGEPANWAPLVGFKAFCSFFAAFAENAYGENKDLFPPSLRPLADAMEQDISSWVLDLTDVES